MRARPHTIAIPQAGALARPRYNRAPIRPSAFAAADPAVLDLWLVGEIGFDVSGDALALQVAAFHGSTINLRINSPGGSVFQGLAIYNALIQHPAKVIAHVDGWAASIASVIMCAADEIRIGAAAQVMIHAPWSAVMGPAADMRKEADVLDKIEQSLIGVYTARTGLSRATVAAQVAAETWFSGPEAVAAGYADVVVGLKGKPEAPVPTATDTTYRNMPADLRNALKAAITEHAGRSGRIESQAHLERELRERLKLSNGAAKKLAANGWRGLAGDDNSEIENLAARIAKAGVELTTMRKN